MNATTNQSKPARTPRDYSSSYGWTQTDENNRREVERLLAELERRSVAVPVAGSPPAPKPEDADDDSSRPELPDDDIPAEPDDYVPPPSHGNASAAPNDDEPPFDPDKDDGDRRPRHEDRHADDNGSGYDDGHYEREDMKHERQQQRAREAMHQTVGVPVVSESEGVILP